MVCICMTGGRKRDARVKFWPRCRTPKNEARAPHLLIALLIRDEAFAAQGWQSRRLQIGRWKRNRGAGFTNLSGVFLMSEFF